MPCIFWGDRVEGTLHEIDGSDRSEGKGPIGVGRGGGREKESPAVGGVSVRWNVSRLIAFFCLRRKANLVFPHVAQSCVFSTSLRLDNIRFSPCPVFFL